MARFGCNDIGFFGNLSGGSAITGTPYGSFYDTTIQSATLPNTAYAMKLNSSDSPYTSGVVITNNAQGNPTRILVKQTGIYNLQFSAQLQRSSGTNSQVVDIWLRKNDNTGDLANTNTHVEMQGTLNYLVTAWNFFVSLNANDFVELMWATTSTTIQLYYDAPSSPHPATPSLIVTMNKVS